MKRLSILFALGALLQANPGNAQDTLTFYNRKTGKEETVKGYIQEESPTKVRYRVGAKVEEVSALDVVQISYQTSGDIPALAWRAPGLREDQAATNKDPVRRTALLKEALDLYKGLLPKVGTTKPHRRHVDFRIAILLSQMTENDASGVDEAIAALKKFKSEHGDGWQLVTVVKTLARLQEQKGDAAGAQVTYEELAANPALPVEVRREFSLLVVRYLLRKGKHAEARARALEAQKGVGREDPLALKVQSYLLACDAAAGKLDTLEKPLLALLQGAADGDSKALACNTLGDYYRTKGQGEAAFWQYLWVDVHYNQDREEVARALYNLSKLFVDVRKDTVRARECLDRLCDEKEFGGLDYHKKALAERAATGM